MKKNLAITLHRIHLGSAREVVTLDIDGKDAASKFLTKLASKDKKAFESIVSRIKAVAEHEQYSNKNTFRNVGDGIFEFKRNTPKLIRLYAFYDDIDDIGKLILCTNGGDKNDQIGDINTAKTLKKRYFAAKKQPDTELDHKTEE